MNYGNSAKATSPIGNYFSKQNAKLKGYHHTKGNNTIISEKEILKSPIRSVYPGISKGQEAKTKFKTTQNSPERLFKKSDKVKDIRDVSIGKKESVISNHNMQTKNVLSTTKIQELIKDGLAFDSLFIKKIQKIKTKNSYSNNHLTHSNCLINKPNKISLEISQQNSQLYPKNSKHNNLSKKNSFFHYKKSNSTLEEEETIKELASNDFNYIKGTQGTSAKITSPRLQSGKGEKNKYYQDANKYPFKENGIQSIQNKDLQYAKSKSNPKTGSTQNINSKSNQQPYSKYSSALLNNNKSPKSSGIILPLDCIHSKSNKNISADVISKTTCHTKNNSRKPSAEKNMKIFNHNQLIQSLGMNNYLLSDKVKGNLISGKGSTSSLIKKNSELGSNSTPLLNQTPSHIKRLSEVSNIKLLLNNTLNNGYDLQKSSQFAATSKNFINMNDIKYIGYVTSNIKGSNLVKTPSSLNSKLNKKKEELEKDFLQAKLHSIQQNKSVTTIQSKQNSKSTSRVEDFPINPIAKTPKNNINEINNIINDKQSVYNINFIINTNQVPVGNKESTPGLNLLKYSSPATATQSPIAKSQKEFNNVLNMKKKSEQEKEALKEQNNCINIEENTVIKKLDLDDNKKKEEIKLGEPAIVSSDKIYNETYESLQSTVRESSYYRNEMEKISNYIRHYRFTNGTYPESKMEFYKIGRVIGKGAFGKVNLALHICSGRLVAIKSFNKSKLKNKREKTKIKHEINALRKLQHPFISQILDTFETEKHILIVMEYICGDLLSFIRKRSKITENSSKVIFKQIIEGLDFIHSNKIVHRDIKLDNILIDINNTVKICDFGVSRKLNPGDIMHEHCGTLAYIAPEIFLNNGYEGYTCDIWSAGVTLYYMLSGSLPFKVNNTANFHEKIISGKYEKLQNISPEARDLIDGMLQIDPRKRLTIHQILCNPWLSGINLKYRGNINMFTNAEKILLRKYDVNYLRSNKEEMVENFTIKNLDTIVEEERKHGNTKSLILAPYNSYASFIGTFSSDDIKIENALCKFCGKVKQANIKYLLNNNEDFDNGVIITQNGSNENNDNAIQGKQSFSNNNSFSKPISPNVELNDEINVISGLNSPTGKIKNEINYDISQGLIIRENIVREIEANIGYDYDYIIKCLKKKEVNYATATYYLITRDFNDNILG